MSLTRGVLLFAGGLFTALGVIGIFIPIWPTTPFLLLAAGCFCRSWPAAYRWLLDNRFFGVYLRNYREGRGLPVMAKVLILGMLWITIGYSVVAVTPLWSLRVGLLLIALAVTGHIITIPNGTVQKQPLEPCRREQRDDEH